MELFFGMDGMPDCCRNLSGLKEKTFLVECGSYDAKLSV
jgi:hypothetical protein